ncbi:MAG: nitroreductase family protein [Victivallales bacterium]|nr:nitroreductase family protein [Victivallales bacterium]
MDDFDAFLSLVSKRASCRSYLDKPVEDEKIRKCLLAASLAPSACNKQPWRFKIVIDPAERHLICSRGLLPGLPMPWLKDAPVIVILCADTSFVVHTIAPMLSKVSFHLVDCGIAGQHFVLAAEALGLGTCWIGWFKPKKIRQIANIPRSMHIVSLISLGYPAGPQQHRTKFTPENISIE